MAKINKKTIDKWDKAIKETSPKVDKIESLKIKARRDPHNTAGICHLLIREKIANPYMRFGQLLVNALGVNDLFYIEDDELLQLMEDMYEE